MNSLLRPTLSCPSAESSRRQADPSRHAEIELGAEEIGLILFHGEEIDLRDAVQEDVLMAVPMKTLCRPECKGLCPQCGADLNQGDCGCERKIINPKFAGAERLD